VADVEALDALRTFGQPQRLAQRVEAALLSGAIAHVLRDGQQRVLARHVEPYAPLTVRGCDHLHVFQLDRLAHDHQRGQRLLQIVLLEECLDHLGGRGAFGIRGEEAAIADVAPASDHHQVDARNAALDHAGDHVGVHAAIRFDILADLHTSERAHLVAIDRCLLVVPLVRCALHLLRQPLDDIILPSLQE